MKQCHTFTLSSSVQLFIIALARFYTLQMFPLKIDDDVDDDNNDGDDDYKLTMPSKDEKLLFTLLLPRCYPFIVAHFESCVGNKWKIYTTAKIGYGRVLVIE